MRMIVIPVLAWVLLASAALAQQAPPPAAPQMVPSEGAAAVALARQAMAEYLQNRTPAAEVRIPDAAKSLPKKNYGAAVTLRSGGLSIGQGIRQEADLARNVIDAAFAAMRSPKLPDVVTADYLAGLTVEIEVLSPPQKAQEANLARSITPGLTGLTSAKGLDEVTILPSASYAFSLSVEEIIRHCLSGLPLKAENASLPVRWAVFSSSHYVGYPDGKVIWLRQGRAPLPPEMIDDKVLSSAAEAVGLFLLRNQDAEGQFTLPAGQPRTTEQFYATYALARLAKVGDGNVLRAGRSAAFKWDVLHVPVHPGEPFALVEGIADEEQLSAVSFLVLAMQEAPPNPVSRDLVPKLLGTVDKALASQRREDDPSSRVKLPLKGLALAYLAASKAAPQEANRLEALRAIIATTPAADAEDICWLLRAGLPLAPDRPGGVAAAPLPVPAAGVLDTDGGLAPEGRPADIVVTALSAVNLAEGRNWPGLNLPAAPAEAKAVRGEMALSAKRFCYQMQYKPLEPYFSPKPVLWLGGIRAAPGGAAISLRACAAAIEAFLAE